VLGIHVLLGLEALGDSLGLVLDRAVLERFLDRPGRGVDGAPDHNADENAHGNDEGDGADDVDDGHGSARRKDDVGAGGPVGGLER
jgi:hypothetical protein